MNISECLGKIFYASLRYEIILGQNSKQLYFWTLIPDDNINFLLFLKINTEMFNRMTEFKENLFFG